MSEEGLQIGEKRKDAKGQGGEERYIRTIDEEQYKQWQTFGGAPKSLQTVAAAMK